MEHLSFRAAFLATMFPTLPLLAGAAGDDRPKSQRAKLAIRKYEHAVEKARSDYDRLVAAAAKEAAAELETVKRAALKSEQLEEANHVVDEIERLGAPGAGTSTDTGTSGTLKRHLSGTTWRQPEGSKLTLNANGTMRHSDPQHDGTWAVAGERAIVVRFKTGFLSVWQFDEGLKGFTGTHYAPQGDQKGSRDASAGTTD